MLKIGVRELRQHASRYLALIAHGERVEVTDRGRPVALMVPIPTDRWQEALASGRVIVPSETGDVTDEPPVDYGVDASGNLAAMRDQER